MREIKERKSNKCVKELIRSQEFWKAQNYFGFRKSDFSELIVLSYCTK